jgi:hypothetical protein
MEPISGLKTVWEGLGRLNRRQKLMAGALAFVVILTWLAVCALLVSFFV